MPVSTALPPQMGNSSPGPPQGPQETLCVLLERVHHPGQRPLALSISKIKLETWVLNYIFRVSLLKWSFLSVQVCFISCFFFQTTLENVQSPPREKMNGWMKMPRVWSHRTRDTEEERKSRVWGEVLVLLSFSKIGEACVIAVAMAWRFLQSMGCSQLMEFKEEDCLHSASL